MTDADNRGEQRADEARRTDDSDLIERMEDAPSFSGVSGHNINQDIATRDDLKQEGGDGSVTPDHESDKPDQASQPRSNQGNSNMT